MISTLAEVEEFFTPQKGVGSRWAQVIEGFTQLAQELGAALLPYDS